MREPILKEPNKTDINYCLAAWKEFTTLTHQEEINLKHILFSLKKPKELIKDLVPVGGRCKVFCKELNILFNTKRECAKFFKTTVPNISQASKGGYKLQRKYTIEEL